MSKPSITNCPNTFFRKFIVSTVFSVHYLVLLVCKYVITHYQVVIAVRSHLFPFRTEKLSSLAPMVLQCGRVGSRLLLSRASDFERFLRLFCFHAESFFFSRWLFFRSRRFRRWRRFLTCSVWYFAEWAQLLLLFTLLLFYLYIRLGFCKCV